MREPVELRALQRRMLARLRGALTAPPLDDGADLVHGDSERDARARLLVYEEAYELRLREALAAYFPRTAAALGDEFATLARRYLAAWPSRHPSLRQLGVRLPAFVDAQAAALALPPWLGALAELELARLDVFDAADERVLTRAQLARLGPEGFAALPIALVAAQRVLALPWDVTAVAGGAAPVELAALPTTLLVGRRGVAVYQRPLDALEAELLATLAEPLPFADVCERIAADVGEARAPEVGCALLARWLDDELVRAP